MRKAVAIPCEYSKLPLTLPLEAVWMESDGRIIARDADGLYCLILPLSRGRFNFHVFKMGIDENARYDIAYNATAKLKRAEIENLFNPISYE